MAEVRWLLVGAGDIARKRVAQALQSAEKSRLTGVCDVNKESAAALAGEHGADEVFTDIDEALHTTAADSVYIATPVWLHASQAVKALEAGKHVLVEKPLGLSEEEGHRVLAASAMAHRTAACAYFRRCSARYRHAKAMVEAGEFGRIVLLRMLYFSWFAPAEDDPKYWRVLRDRSGGGPISDMGSHMFDVLIGLFGLPVSVFARYSNLVHSWEVEDSAAVLMTLDDGALVTASFNWNSKTWRHEFEIVGTEAKLNWLPYDSGKIVKTVGRDVQEIDLPEADNVHLPLVQDFVDGLLEQRAPACPATEAVKTNTLMDAVYASAREHREIFI